MLNFPETVPVPNFIQKMSAPRAEGLRDWVTKFYEENNPEKLTSVDEICQKYAGREEELVLQLERKYGVLPGRAMDVTESLKQQVAEAEKKMAAFRVELAASAADRQRFEKARQKSAEEWARERAQLRREIEVQRHHTEREQRGKEDALRRLGELAKAEAMEKAASQRAKREALAADAVAAKAVSEAALAAIALHRKDTALRETVRRNHDLTAHLDAALSTVLLEETTKTERRRDVTEDESVEVLYQSTRIQLAEAHGRRAEAEERAVELARERKEAREALAEATRRFEEASGSADATRELVEAARADAVADALAKDRAFAALAAEQALRSQSDRNLKEVQAQLQVAAEARRELTLFCKQQRIHLEKEARARVDRAVDELLMFQEDSLSAEVDLQRRCDNVVREKLKDSDDEIYRLSLAVRDLQTQRDDALVQTKKLEEDLATAAKRIHKTESLLKVVSRSAHFGGGDPPDESS